MYISKLLVYGIYCRTSNFNVIAPSIMLVFSACLRDEYRELKGKTHHYIFKILRQAPITCLASSPPSTDDHVNVIEQKMITKY
jgi:hypothetical protein